MTLYTGHIVRVHPDGASSAVDFGAITSFSAPLGIQLLNEVTAGSPYAGQVNIQSADPRFTFSTRDIRKAIATFGFLGLRIAGATNPGVVAYAAQLDNGVIRSGNNHRSMRMRSGRAFLRRISVSNREDAQADCEVMSLYDGANLPVIPADGVSLPVVPSDPARYTISSVTIAGINIPCVQSIDIDNGLNITMDSCSSNPYNEHLSIESVQPTITIRTLNAALFKAAGGIPLTGLNGVHADTIINLRKRSASSIFVDDAEGEHIVITAAGMLTIDDAFNASNNRRGEITFRLTCKFDGTNTPIIYAVDQSI